MELNVSIDPEQINQMVTEAVLQSSIGAAVNTSIENYVKKMSSAYNNPIDDVVKSEVSKAIKKVVEEKMGGVIEAVVREKVTEEFTRNVFDKLWEGFEKNFY